MTVTGKNTEFDTPWPTRLGVMAKYWSAGAVKTRLAAAIGSANAAALHRLFCLHLADQLGQSGESRWFVVSPPERLAAFRQELPDTWETCLQSDGDLGHRMMTWFRSQMQVSQRHDDDGGSTATSRRVPNRCILIGADCPTLDAGTIQLAFEHLATHDVVLGPARDGGYYLIGFSGQWSPRYESLMQEMPWSSDQVFDETVKRVRAAELSLALLPTMEDIDTITELQNLQTQLSKHAPNTPAPNASLHPLLQKIDDVMTTTNHEPRFQSDVTIVGGGVIGLAIAWELAQRSVEVTVLDAGRLGRGTSWAGAGILPPARLDTASDPIDRLRGLSHQLFPRWAEKLRQQTGIDIQLLRCGGWYLADTPGEIGAMVGMTQYWHDLGIECDRRSLAELVKCEPNLASWAANHSGASNIGAGESAAAWWVPDEYQIRTPDYTRALVAACRSLGVQFREFHRVDDVLSASGSVELLGTCGEPTKAGPATSRFRCDSHRVILCGGVGLGRIAGQLRLSQSIVPVRGQVLQLKSEHPPFRSVINLGNRYFVPRVDGLTLVGSNEEEVGLQHGTTPAGLAQLRDFIRKFAPALDDAVEFRAWSGLRPMTFDGFPMIGPVPDQPGVFVAAGHYRSGIHLSPGTAVVMADLITGCQNSLDLDAFRIGKQQQQPSPV
ncbi:FAD-dependent oxidoreductase [Stieleria varia]|uniref:Glycine oxidase n=1 Tax=Stieleria varia TaxID=2528005 RepID=A0A5C6B2W2_9BACT|nr:FAD-dependent oxidoreductase [Stieleria varia]TWU05719.1 Glycine oxidase [Stieleria varia]